MRRGRTSSSVGGGGVLIKTPYPFCQRALLSAILKPKLERVGSFIGINEAGYS